MRAALFAVFLSMLAPLAHAHESSLAFLTLQVDDGRVAGRWDIAIRDLEEVVGLDADGDSVVTWAELQARRSAIVDLAGSRLRLAAGGEPCRLGVEHHEIDRHGGAAFAVLELAADCGAGAGAVTVDYSFLFDVDPTHRALLEISAAGRATAAVLSRDQPSQTARLAELSAWDGFVRFLAEGMTHIWHGYDHLVFLCLLLLPAVLRPVQTRASATVWSIARIVTAFTLAHSLTLALAAYGLIDLPSRAVESVIAASIVVAAFLNLMPRARLIGAPLAFGFGLVHGLGFANALQGLGGNQLVSLTGFNLGVELGQLAVVAIAVPLLFMLRRAEPLRLRVLTAASLACAGVGFFWLAERLA